MSDLAVEHRAALDLIYPIADALQLKLFYNVTEKGARIRGAEKMSLPLDAEDKESIPFEIKVHASTVGENSAWALLKVRGDLWILVGYLRSGRELQLCIVDESKARFGPVTAAEWSGLSVDGVLNKLGRGVVASYYRHKDDSEWRELNDVPAIVDPRQPAEAAAGDRSAIGSGEGGSPDS